MFVHALLLVAAVIVVVVAIRWRLHPFLAIVIAACAFGLAAGFSIGLIGKAFGTGFSQAIYNPGLVIIATALIAGLMDGTSLPAARLTAPLLGLIAGLGATPAAALALLTPLLRASGRTITAALALSASHGLLFSPVLIAATAILGAGWSRVMMIGVPLALLLALVGAVWARFTGASEAPPAPQPAERGSWPVVVLIAATLVPLAMLIVQSLGDIPSEPFGGGPAREFILGLGRPLILLLVGVGITVIGCWRSSLARLTDTDWTTRILGETASIVLIVGAAGGLQKLCQETGMAELIAERMPAHAGVLAPFLMAAIVKTLQGSSLVAALTAAGMVEPMLAQLGLAGDSGRALAALAVGAGAMTMAHINDEYFWVASNGARLSPPRALAAISGGTLVQGLIAAAALMLLSRFASGA